MADTEFIDSLTIKTHEYTRNRKDIIKVPLNHKSKFNEEIHKLEGKLL